MKNMTESAKNRFIELMTRNCKVEGLDELTSKIVGILYAEPKEISLEELTNRTGYSLSAISTAMKFMVNLGFIKRLKKPKSRKVYFYMEKDMVAQMMQMMKKKYEDVILTSKRDLPNIIERYKVNNSETSMEELAIIEDYYRQIQAFEKIISNMIKMFESAQHTAEKKV